jgi:valyl-tRNA synthetase
LSKTGDARVQPDIAVDGLAAPERWILSRLSRTAAEVGRHLESFRFDEACSRLYHFFWGELCDWYIELSKPALGSPHSPASPAGGDAPRPRAAEVLLTVLERSLRLLHPVMPHLSEELWHRLPGHEAVHPETISLAPYPTAVPAWEDLALEERMDTLMAVIGRVRAMRAELQIAPKAAVTLHLAAPAESEAFLREHEPLLRFLLRPQELVYGPPPEGVPQDLVAGVRVGVQTQAAALDEKERQRLQGELAKLEGAIEAAETRLGDDGFLGKAPAPVVEQQRAKLGEMRARRDQLRQGLESS